MKIEQIFLDMLKYPNSPKTYRAMRDFYKKVGKTHESQAFNHLMEVRYNELSDDPDADQKS